jgi:hypothetical protein
VSTALGGPHGIIDGNHQAVALQQRRQLAGFRVFCGRHAAIENDCPWYRRALQASH